MHVRRRKEEKEEDGEQGGFCSGILAGVCSHDPLGLWGRRVHVRPRHEGILEIVTRRGKWWVVAQGRGGAQGQGIMDGLG